jgi:hypothetical protein
VPIDEKRKKFMENMAIVTISMPDGKDYDFPLHPKVYKSGREGYYAQIPPIILKGKSYRGQVMLYERDSGQVALGEEV